MPASGLHPPAGVTGAPLRAAASLGNGSGLGAPAGSLRLLGHPDGRWPFVCVRGVDTWRPRPRCSELDTELHGAAPPAGGGGHCACPHCAGVVTDTVWDRGPVGHVHFSSAARSGQCRLFPCAWRVAVAALTSTSLRVSGPERAPKPRGSSVTPTRPFRSFSAAQVLASRFGLLSHVSTREPT